MKLTSLGNKIVDDFLAEHKRVKPNDAKMAVFLQFGVADGLLVDTSTDIDALRQQISVELRSSHIRFPYILGRELHDAAAEMFPAITQLDNSQTIRLLNKLPIGVFQDGRTVVGPYGCTYSDAPREVSAGYSVPGYLCSDEACSAVHTIYLSTGDSSIMKARNLLSRYLEKHYSQADDENMRLIREAFEVDSFSLYPFPTTNLVDLLSDGLSEDELRVVIDHLLRRTFKREGRRRDIAVRLGAAIANPSEFVNGIRRPELLQIALLHADSDIIFAIDEAVQSGNIKLQEFEIRTGKISRWADGPSAQIGALGFRFASTPPSRFAAEQVLRLLHGIYYDSDIWDAGDLAYAIEAPNNLSDGELLDRAVRQYTPSDLLTRLILPNRRAASTAAQGLGIFDHENLSREQLLENMRWKMGEPATATFTELMRVKEHWKYLDEANRGRQGTDTLRSHASNLFAAVEDTLSRALIFCTWMLSEDHYLSPEAFIYDPLVSAKIVQFIEAHAPSDEMELRLRSDGKNTLTALGAGFARLAKALRNLNPEDNRRSDDDLPVICAASSRPFAYPFKMFFFNLEQSAKADVLTKLQATSRLMQNDDVIDLRNSTAHGNRPFPESEQIEKALSNISALVANLETSGLYPRLYEFIQLSRDGLGREELIYDGGGEQISFFRPGWAIAPKLPMGQTRLIIVPIARIDSCGALRFRLQPRPGGDPYWEGWPKRWPAQASYGETEKIVASQDFAQTA